MLTLERLRQLLAYDPETGAFTRLVAAPGRSGVGSAVGSVKSGYLFTHIDRKAYSLHRLAWFFVHGSLPEMRVDHIDGDTLNNRIANLRLATHAQNLGNSKRRKDNTSGFKGVSADRSGARWRAQIKRNGRIAHLGTFDTPEEAHAAYVAAATELFGEFARAS